MARLLRIDQCSDCTHLVNGFLLGRTFQCAIVQTRDGKARSIRNRFSLPKWCPLPEAPQEDKPSDAEET
jgi:hypothetical protein